MGRPGIFTRLVIAILLVIGATALAAGVQVGEKAPDFTLPATTTEKFSLSEFQGKKHVVFFGFIGAFTPT